MMEDRDLERVWRQKVLNELIAVTTAIVSGSDGLTNAELRAAPVPVSVTVLPLPTGASTEATMVSILAGLASIFARQANGTQHTVIDNASIAVTGAFFPATQPVSAAALPLPAGASTEATLALIKAKTDNLDVALSTRAVTGLTDAQLRAVAVPVSGTFFQATQPVSGTVTATGPLTNTQLRATPVTTEMGDSQSVDAFGRVRVSFPDAVFEVTHQYDLNQRRMGLQRQDTATTITHVTPTAVLAVPAVAGRRICHQAHRYHIYQPGKSTLIKVTGQLGDTTILAGMGYGDDDDGIFLERTSSGFQLRFVSTTTADVVVTQASWNVDKLDGTGVSGLTLNGAFSQQFTIDLQWLGVGRVRVGFVLNGGLFYCHYFNFGNAIAGPYMRTGSLPIRWYAESLGAVGSMTAICAAVTSEGGHTPEGRHFGYAMGTSKAIGAAGVRTPFMSLRPKATFNAITNRAHVLPSSLRAMVTTADNVMVEVVRNATTLTGATWAIDPNTESHAEIDLAATVIAGGEILWCDFISSTNRDVDANDLLQWPLTLKADGTADTFTICLTRIAGAASAHCGINWKEMY